MLEFKYFVGIVDGSTIDDAECRGKTGSESLSLQEFYMRH